MASNKYVDLKTKIKNFVRSKCYAEDMSKDKGGNANFRKSCKNFKRWAPFNIQREKNDI